MRLERVIQVKKLMFVRTVLVMEDDVHLVMTTKECRKKILRVEGS